MLKLSFTALVATFIFISAARSTTAFVTSPVATFNLKLARRLMPELTDSIKLQHGSSARYRAAVRPPKLASAVPASQDDDSVDSFNDRTPAWLKRLRSYSELQCLGALGALVFMLASALVATRDQPGPPCILLRNLLAGGVPPALFEALLFPIEVVKVRLQTTPTAAQRGLLATAQQLWRDEGARALWSAGVVAGCMRGLCYQGLRLGLFPPLKALLFSTLGSQHDANSLLARVFAGCATGCLGAFLTSPLDLVKVRMTAAATKSSYANSLDAMVTVARTEGGWRGLWRASGVNMLRASVASGAQLTAYDASKAGIAALVAAAAAATEAHAEESAAATTLLSSAAVAGVVLPFLATVVSLVGSSVVAAVAYTAASAPVDLLKSRCMAAKPDDNNGKNTNLLSMIVAIVRAEGPLGLWRGWGVSTARLLPVIVLVFPAMERFRLLLGIGAF